LGTEAGIWRRNSHHFGILTKLDGRFSFERFWRKKINKFISLKNKKTKKTKKNPTLIF